MKKRIELLEKKNYRLYVLISLLLGVLFFTISYFSSSKVMEMVMLNEADKVYKIKNISQKGFDIEVNSIEELKLRYYFGKSEDMMVLISETKDFVKNDLQQIRSIIPDTNNFFQIEIQKKDGTIVKSQIINVNDMIK